MRVRPVARLLPHSRHDEKALGVTTHGLVAHPITGRGGDAARVSLT